IYDLQKELKSIKKRDTELGFRAQKTDEYLQKFAKLDEKKAAELKKKIEELNIPRLREEHISKLIDILPADAEEVRMVLSAYATTVTNENLVKLADVIKDYRK
ncbi:hypothetical protein JXB27_02730, partial [Candidatus Woesearchaeota archaeon]|nr:hypothetical protein [Candidatus Woesearchaeota archaeon]